MPFRLRTDAEKWFSEIKDRAPFRVKFDIYYFCLLAGLATGRKSDVGTDKTAPIFVDYFVEEYREIHRILIGLLLLAELKEQEVSLEEKTGVRRIVRELIDPSTPTHLTADGMRALNGYVSGGYEFLAEKRAQKPYSAEEFFLDYAALIDGQLGEKPFWGTASGS